MSHNITHHPVECQAWRVLGDAVVSTPAGRVCQAVGVESQLHQTDSDKVIIGRAAIARALGRSPRTVTRWYRAGIPLAAKIGPAANNAMIVRADYLNRLVHS